MLLSTVYLLKYSLTCQFINFTSPHPSALLFIFHSFIRALIKVRLAQRAKDAAKSARDRGSLFATQSSGGQLETLSPGTLNCNIKASLSQLR